VNSYTRQKNKVHKKTQLVKDILSMDYCKNPVLIAKVLSCSSSYVRQIKAQAKSSAHIFLSVETIKNLN
jgi:hypothetical protein